MGKKRNYDSKVKKSNDNKLAPATRKVTINLHRRLYKTQFKKKTPRAVKEIRQYAQQVMRTKDVRIDPELNKNLWKNGVRNLDPRVNIVLERKKNEENEDGGEEMYTVVKLDSQ